MDDAITHDWTETFELVNGVTVTRTPGEIRFSNGRFATNIFTFTKGEDFAGITLANDYYLHRDCSSEDFLFVLIRAGLYKKPKPD